MPSCKKVFVGKKEITTKERRKEERRRIEGKEDRKIERQNGERQ